MRSKFCSSGVWGARNPGKRAMTTITSATTAPTTTTVLRVSRRRLFVSVPPLGPAWRYKVTVFEAEAKSDAGPATMCPAPRPTPGAGEIRWTIWRLAVGSSSTAPAPRDDRPRDVPGGPRSLTAHEAAQHRRARRLAANVPGHPRRPQSADVRLPRPDLPHQ